VYSCAFMPVCRQFPLVFHLLCAEGRLVLPHAGRNPRDFRIQR
jgi:hypothetical protein